MKSEIGDILIPSSTTTTGIDLITSSCVKRKNVRLGGDINVLRPKKDINSEFFSYFFSNFMYRKVLGFTQGVTIIHLYGSDLKKLTIEIPKLKEQNEIINILTKADEEIKLLQEQLQYYKLQKKGLMQVLLTGRKRLA